MSAAAGPAAAKPYTISLIRPAKEKDGDGIFYQSSKETAKKKIPRYGNFRVSKAFRVVKTADGKRDGVKGVVIQEVEKITNITLVKVDSDGRETRQTLNAENAHENAIEDLTLQNVKFMWGRYFEIFIISDGLSVDVDSFQNGAICTYSEGGEGEEDTAEIEDTYPPSELPYTYSFGEIKMIGRSVFFPMRVLPPMTSKTEIDAMDAEVIKLLPPEIKDLKTGGMGWDADKKWPANGLPYLPWSAENAARIFSTAESDPFVHTVDVRWTLPGESATGSQTIFASTPPIPDRHALGGGSRRNLRARTKKRKTYRKRSQ